MTELTITYCQVTAGFSIDRHFKSLIQHGSQIRFFCHTACRSLDGIIEETLIIINDIFMFNITSEGKK